MTYLESQKPYKPKIDDVIGDLLDGEKLSRALEFIAYLKNKKMSFRWANTNTWKVVCKGVTIFYIKAGIERDTGQGCYVKFLDINNPVKGSWLIVAPVQAADDAPRLIPDRVADGFVCIADNGDYEEILSNEVMVDMVLSKLRKCTNCGNKNKCAPGITVNLWGRELSNRCKFIGFPFVDPTQNEIECVKALIKIYLKLKGITQT